MFVVFWALFALVLIAMIGEVIRQKVGESHARERVAEEAELRLLYSAWNKVFVSDLTYEEWRAAREWNRLRSMEEALKLKLSAAQSSHEEIEQTK
jgi:Na+-transporting methylmalonyl-CoA/oxaloacetate decarboxylase gamma subunit